MLVGFGKKRLLMVDHGCPSPWLSVVDHDHGWLWLVRVYYG